MKKILLIIALLPVTSYSATIASSVGKISEMRTTSSNHMTTNAQGETIFKVNSGHLPGCQWLGVTPDDKAFVSFLLSAKAQSSDVEVWYYSDLTSPAWPNVCQATTIELK